MWSTQRKKADSKNERRRGQEKENVLTQSERLRMRERKISSRSLVMTLHYNNGHLVCVFEKDVCISAYASASVCVCACVCEV